MGRFISKWSQTCNQKIFGTLDIIFHTCACQKAAAAYAGQNTFAEAVWEHIQCCTKQVAQPFCTGIIEWASLPLATCCIPTSSASPTDLLDIQHTLCSFSQLQSPSCFPSGALVKRVTLTRLVVLSCLTLSSLGVCLTQEPAVGCLNSSGCLNSQPLLSLALLLWCWMLSCMWRE